MNPKFQSHTILSREQHRFSLLLDISISKMNRLKHDRKLKRDVDLKRVEILLSEKDFVNLSRSTQISNVECFL